MSTDPLERRLCCIQNRPARESCPISTSIQHSSPKTMLHLPGHEPTPPDCQSGMLPLHKSAEVGRMGDRGVLGMMSESKLDYIQRIKLWDYNLKLRINKCLWCRCQGLVLFYFKKTTKLYTSMEQLTLGSKGRPSSPHELEWGKWHSHSSHSNV